MAKLHFFYSTMNAGKSTALLQSNHNYIESSLKTLLFIPHEIAKKSNGKIISRIGLEAEAIVVSKEYEFFREIENKNFKEVSCIFVDEAQFLSQKQVHDLGKIADELNIPVLAFGIRTDFQGNLFEGSKFLLAWADNLKEIKTVCHCGRKATMVLRLNEEGLIVSDGSQIEIGGEEKYVSVCRKHFQAKDIGES